MCPKIKSIFRCDGDDFMIIVIDNYDSFTYNLVHYIGEFEQDIKVIRNDEMSVSEIMGNNPSKIVLSPGPGSPKDYPLTSKIYKKYKGKKKIIGICLGYQLILFNEKGKIVKQKNIFHGYQSKVKVTK